LVKKACRLGALSILLVSCVTVAPPPPNLYIENLPQSLVTPLTLEERIQMEEAWDFLRQNRPDKAEKAFLRLGPASPLYAVGLGYVSLLLEDFPAAEENLKLALTETPGSLLAHLGLAQLYQKTGEEDKAFNALREVLKVDPLNSWAREGYEGLKLQKTEQAVASAREAAARGENETAKESYLKALHYSPESVEIHLALAGLYKSENKIPSALVHLKAAIEGAPDNIEALQMYAATLAEAKQYDRSLDVYQRVLELDSENQAARQQVEELKNKLGIVELPSRYNEIPLATAVTREDIAALLAVKLRDVLAETSVQPPIIVDISASWASKYILKVTTLGLLMVHSNHAFQPKRTVTRAELADTLYRTIQYLESKGHRFIHQIPPNRIQVQDVTPDHIYFQPINQIISYQVMELYPDKTFRTDQPVPGTEAVKAIDILLALAR
jgi:tetratricopeptide (TPR) repeat protein